MASIRDIKLRIQSTRNIEHITKAMKMVAAARLKKAQERLDSARPYARKMAEVTLDLAALTPWSFNRLLRPHHHMLRILMVVFTGDRGLAGGFHNNIVDKALEFGEKLDSRQLSYYIIGEKGYHRFQQRRIPVYKRFDQAVAGVSFAEAQAIAEELITYYKNEKFDKIYLFYAKFYSAMNQKPRPFQVLPIDPAQAARREAGGLFVFKPDRKRLLNELLPRYMESEIFRGFLETEAGELGARMTAMSAASDSAADIIHRYQLKFNRLRQEQITTELNEIIGGADALKKK